MQAEINVETKFRIRFYGDKHEENGKTYGRKVPLSNQLNANDVPPSDAPEYSNDGVFFHSTKNGITRQHTKFGHNVIMIDTFKFLFFLVFESA